MATTADWVFEKAIWLMDEQNEASGAALSADTQEYRHRTLGILNVLRNELYPISDTFAWEQDGRRPVCPEILRFDQEIGLDDAVAQGVMPYGLAAHLLLGENDAMANFFAQRYWEMFAQMRAAIPAGWESIPMAYGGVSK